MKNLASFRPRLVRLAPISSGLAVLLLVLGCLGVPAWPQDERAVYARSRDFDLQHLRLDLVFDFPQRKVLATAFLWLEPLNSGLTEVALDSVGLEIESVTLAGQPLMFRRTDDKLYITLDRSYDSGARLELTIRYTAQPQKGLYFVMPDEDYPDRPHQIWSQGQFSDNRYWFPSYDFPNDKTTTEMRVTVSADWEVVSNGKLLGVHEDKHTGTRTFHWLQDKPHSTYLVSLVAGDFERHEEQWKDLPLRYYVPPGQGANVAHTFGRTANMMRFFSANIGPYPWAQYAQSVVEDFLYGGMENTSATTVNHSWLLESELLADRQLRNDDGIAHELAHQWFGDSLTCKDWRHIWLNEGFATYFASLWGEHYYGRDEFDWSMLRRGAAITGAKALPESPLVPRPNQVPGNVYSKGAWVLHMVRHQLGDARFWTAIQLYVHRHSYQNVESPDFLRAVADATGQNLEWLFDQYVYAPGHPEFEVVWDYSPETRLVHLSVKQNLKRDDKPVLFRVPVDVELVADDTVKKFTAWVSREAEDFYFPFEQWPRTVLFDPENRLLKKLTFKKDEGEWLYQLQHAQRVVNRIEAARALGKSSGRTEVLVALERAGTGDSFYGVRVEVAEALGELKSEAARPVLHKMMIADRHRRVRSAAIGALGSLQENEDTVARLVELARTDESLLVRAGALRALGKLKPDNRLDLLQPFLQVDSARETVRVAAVGALDGLQGDKALPVLLEWSQRGKPVRIRLAALRALGSVGKGKQEVRERLLEALDDSYFRVRGAAIGARGQRRETAAADALERLARSEPHESLATLARATVESLHQPHKRTGGTATEGGELAELGKRLAEVEKESKELKARLDRLENQSVSARQK